MKWIKLTIPIQSTISEEVGALLMEFGALGIEEEIKLPKELPPFSTHPNIEDIKQLSTSHEVKMHAYFKDLNHDQLKLIIEKIKPLQKSIPNWNRLQIHREEIEDQDWLREWKKDFKPIRIGSNIVISPTWEKAKNKPTDVTIYLDPGMAFGTGHHDTTASCLKYLESIIKKKKPKSLLDVGTGSGILTIMAAKLGVNKIFAIDIDKESILVAKKNAELNEVSKLIKFSTTPLQKIDTKFDIIVANILLQPLIEYAHIFKKLLSINGNCILSGVLKKQKEEIIAAYRDKNKFDLISKKESGEWITFVFEKRGK